MEAVQRIARKPVRPTVADVLRRTDEKLSAHNRTAVDFTSEPRDRRTSLYPRPALQQLVRNAIMHRRYEATKLSDMRDVV